MPDHSLLAADSPQRVTIRDIARQLGLSPRSVSQVLGKHRTSTTRISPKTAERIKNLADKLNYRSQPFARALQGEALCQAGFVIRYAPHQRGHLPQVIFPAILGASDHLTDQDWHLNIIREDGKRELLQDLPRYLREHSFDGLILNSENAATDKIVMSDLNRYQIPFILLNGISEHNAVILNDTAGMAKATRHLIELGHKKIIFISGPIDEDSHHSTGVRRDAYLNTMRQAGLFPKVWQHRKRTLAPDLPEEVYVAFRKEVQQEFLSELYLRERPTGMVFSSDLEALQCCQVLLSSGVRIPEDVSIVGFNDMPFVYLHHPALTTVMADFYRMGKEAATLLLQLLEGKDNRIPSVVVEPELIVRGSTAPPSK